MLYPMIGVRMVSWNEILSIFLGKKLECGRLGMEGQERERVRWGREGQRERDGAGRGKIGRESINNHKSFLFCHL